MRATVVTLFPDLLKVFLDTSVLGRAVRRAILRVDLVDLRTFGEGPTASWTTAPSAGARGWS